MYNFRYPTITIIFKSKTRKYHKKVNGSYTLMAYFTGDHKDSNIY